jgi:hypothetical protein
MARTQRILGTVAALAVAGYFLSHEIKVLGFNPDALMAAATPNCGGAADTVKEIAQQHRIGLHDAIDTSDHVREAAEKLEQLRQQNCQIQMDRLRNGQGTAVDRAQAALALQLMFPWANTCDPHFNIERFVALAGTLPDTSQEQVAQMQQAYASWNQREAAWRAQAIANASYALDTIALKAVDHHTGAVTCSAQITTTVDGGTARTPIVFLVERSADAKLVVTVNGE